MATRDEGAGEILEDDSKDSKVGGCKGSQK